MEQIRQVMKQLIKVSEDELNDFLSQSITKTFKRQDNRKLDQTEHSKRNIFSSIKDL